MTEYEKMVAGLMYDPSDSELFKMRIHAHELCAQYNETHEMEYEKRMKIFDELIPHHGIGVYFQGPIYIDYGINLRVGDGTYANFNFTCLDVSPVTIGKCVFMGTGVSLETPVHPMLYKERNPFANQLGVVTDLEYSKPITIEDNCWIASNVTIIGGVTIGEGSVIGAGSVVTRDIPKNTFACGNPCKVVRELTEADSVSLHKELF